MKLNVFWMLWSLTCGCGLIALFRLWLQARQERQRRIIEHAISQLKARAAKAKPQSENIRRRRHHLTPPR